MSCNVSQVQISSTAPLAEGEIVAGSPITKTAHSRLSNTVRYWKKRH